MTYKFIDLFAGIGGFRLGFEKAGFECVFSSEIDSHAQEMYYTNFGDLPSGDIRDIKIKSIPSFDILLAGFPCQPFSIAGEKKGFNDIRGTLFFDIAKILEYYQPKVVVLENVKHFKNHDRGKTLSTILTTLNNLGYTTNWSLLNAIDFDIPQNRERTIIIGYLGDIEFDFSKLKKVKTRKLKDILENDSQELKYLKEDEYTLIDNPKQQMSGLIFAGYLNKNIRINGILPDTKHLSRVHKQPNRIYSSEGTHPTLSSQESAGRYYILHHGKVRKLTLRECYRLMGFPDDFKLIGSKAKLYNRVGNSIVIPMVQEIAIQVKEQLFNYNFTLKYSLSPKQMSLLDLGLLCH